MLACGIGSLTGALKGDRVAAEKGNQAILVETKRTKLVNMLTANAKRRRRSASRKGSSACSRGRRHRRGDQRRPGRGRDASHDQSGVPPSFRHSITRKYGTRRYDAARLGDASAVGDGSSKWVSARPASRSSRM